MKLKDARILITGGSSGIGKATAEMLIAAGAKVAITGRDEAKLNEVVKAINALAIHADVADERGRQQTIDAIRKEWQGLDVLINNAGIGEFAELQDVSQEAFERVYNVNVFGLALLTQQAAKIFMEQQSGNIINIASTAGLKGFAGGSIYASSKFALRGMTECWRAELRKYNIRVMLVCPSEVTTAFNQPGREERDEQPDKLRGEEIASAIKGALEMDDRGFIPELSVWATNPK